MLPNLALAPFLLAVPDGLHPEWIPAQVSVVAHLDLEALAQGRVGRVLLRHSGGMDVDALKRVLDWAEELELETGKDVRGMTVYGADDETFEPVLIVTMSAAAERLVASLPERADHELHRVEGREIHSFVSDDERFYAHVAPERKGSRPVVLTRDLDQVGHALAALEGQAPSLAGTDSSLASLGKKPGSFVAFSSSDVSRLDQGPTSQIFGETQAVRFEAGEHEGRFFAELLIVGRAEDSVANIADMAQGILALGRLIARNEDTPDDVKAGRLLLLDSVRFAAEGRNFRVSFQCDAEKLARLLETDEDRLAGEK